MMAFNRPEQFAKRQKPPAVKFKDLEDAVTSKITFNILPMKVRADFFPLTEASVLTYITLQFENKDMQFQAKEGDVDRRLLPSLRSLRSDLHHAAIRKQRHAVPGQGGSGEGVRQHLWAHHHHDPAHRTNLRGYCDRGLPQ